MSTLASMGCSHKLQEGAFWVGPRAVHETIGAYLGTLGHSFAGTGAELRWIPEDWTRGVEHRAPEQDTGLGPVAVFASRADRVVVSLSNILHDADSEIPREREWFARNREAFSLPWVYFMGYAQSDRHMRFLASMLKPGHEVEYFTYWSDPTEEELANAVRRTWRLEDCLADPERMHFDSSSFLTITAPDLPLDAPEFRPYREISCAVWLDEDTWLTGSGSPAMWG